MEDHAAENPIVEGMLDEWKRGMLPYWTLGLLLQRDMYGYEIKKEIELSTASRIRLGVSTMPQLLRRLESKKLVESHWEASSHGPRRAYYQITPAGKAVLQAYIQQVLSPNSPIYHAISALTANIFQLLSGSKHGPSPENDQKKEPI
jgi:PadR family transcriptional regulator, regulatory protein PadR